MRLTSLHFKRSSSSLPSFRCGTEQEATERRQTTPRLPTALIGTYVTLHEVSTTRHVPLGELFTERESDGRTKRAQKASFARLRPGTSARNCHRSQTFLDAVAFHDIKRDREGLGSLPGKSPVLFPDGLLPITIERSELLDPHPRSRLRSSEVPRSLGLASSSGRRRTQRRGKQPRRSGPGTCLNLGRRQPIISAKTSRERGRVLETDLQGHVEDPRSRAPGGRKSNHRRSKSTGSDELSGSLARQGNDSAMQMKLRHARR